MNINIKIPQVGFLEVLLVCCGFIFTNVFLVDRDGPQVVGVLIGLFFIFIVVWEYRGLSLWAQREGYELVSMRGVLLGCLYYDVPPRSLKFRVVLRDPRGVHSRALVAFGPLDVFFKSAFLCELDEEFVENGQTWSFVGESIFFGALNLYSIYVIATGFSNWNHIVTHTLITATATSDEFGEVRTIQLLPGIKYAITENYANLAFRVPSVFPDRNFSVKAHLIDNGRKSRWIVRKGDSVPLWVNTDEPEKGFSIDFSPNKAIGSSYHTSGRDMVHNGLAGFLITGLAFLYYVWRKSLQNPFYNSNDR